MSEWIIERDMVDYLQKTLGIPVFMGLAPENAKDPFAVLQTITTGAVRTLEFFHPLFQLDVYERTAEKATREAERVILFLNGTDAECDSTLFDSIRAERATLIRVEDGTWKVPIEITANCIRRR